MSETTRRDFFASSAAISAGLTLPISAPAAQKPAEPPFQLGLVTYNTAAKWDLKTLLNVCKQVGLAAVEARTTHRHGIEPTLNAQQRKDVAKQFKDAGVVFWGSGSTCEFHSPDQSVVRKQIEECRRFVDLVAALGGKGVKVRPNGLPKEVPVEKTLEQIGKALIECGKAAEAQGVEIWVEVHGRGTSDPRHMKTIMELCGHRAVGACWNSNGSDIIDGGIEKAFAMLKPYLKSCHINYLYNDRLGKYPYRTLFRLLREAGYDRYTLIESGWTPPDVRSGTEMLQYYKSLWDELARG